ncbi:MAG: hypothetical protein ACRDPW_03495 [Mycobacteriales bacterium]
MTTKERLHHLVDSLDENAASELLDVALSRSVMPVQRRALPSFVGAGDSGCTHISSHARALVRDELGNQSA